MAFYDNIYTRRIRRAELADELDAAYVAEVVLELVEE